MNATVKEKYFTTHEAAKMCHVTRGSVIRWIHVGKLKACITAGGHHRISARDLVGFLRSLNVPLPKELRGFFQTDRVPKILIVDDEENIRKLLLDFFKKNYPHCSVEEAGEGFEAGIKLKNLQPDLVLLDLVLPGMDGFRICQTIRSQTDGKTIKIIAITGVPEEEFEKRMLNLGADDFLFKPFSLDQLGEKILRHLPWIKRSPFHNSEAA